MTAIQASSLRIKSDMKNGLRSSACLSGGKAPLDGRVDTYFACCKAQTTASSPSCGEVRQMHGDTGSRTGCCELGQTSSREQTKVRMTFVQSTVAQAHLESMNVRVLAEDPAASSSCGEKGSALSCGCHPVRIAWASQHMGTAIGKVAKCRFTIGSGTFVDPDRRSLDLQVAPKT